MKHNIKVFAFILLLITGFGSIAFAQENRNISLDEAIQLSIKSNNQLRVANAKVDEAIATYHEAWNNQLPDLKASGTYMRLNNPDVTLKLKLGSGSGNPAAAIKINEASYTMANASIPVFSGLKIRYGIESAKYLEKATKLDAENQKEEIIANTINAYSILYKAQESVDIVRQNLKQQEQRVTDFTNLANNGLLATNDLLKVRLQQSNIQLTLLDAESNLKITRINLSLMLGLPENTDIIADSAAFNKTEDAGFIANWEQTALQSRKDIQALSYREKASNTAIKSVKGEYYPGLAVTGGYMAANIPGLVTINDALNVGFGLQYNFGALWKTPAKVNAAKARLVQLQATENILTDQVRLQINKAYQSYILSVKKIEVYVKAIEQAKENYRLTKNKYDNNLLTVTDLLEADVAQLQAELNYTLSKVDAFTAFKNLQQTAGLLTDTKN